MLEKTEETGAVIGGWLIDGSGGPVKKKVLISFDQGRIQSIKEAGNEDFRNQDIIDLSHCTLLPPLIDSHVHLCMSGTIDSKIRKHQLEAGFSEIRPVIDTHLNNHLSYGILAVRDGGDHFGHTLKYRSEKYRSDFSASDGIRVCMKAAGRAWHRKGYYGKLIGRALDNNEGLHLAISHDDDPADHVKIVNSGLNSLSVFGKQTSSRFTLADMTKGVKAAKRRNLPVMVHCNGEDAVNISVKAGCDSVEHGFFMGEKNLALMAENRTFWVPTAVTMYSYIEYFEDDKLQADIAERNLEHQLMQMTKARQLGVLVAAGSDAGSPGVDHGSGLIEELGLLMKAGYSVPETIKCATKNSASLLKLLPEASSFLPCSFLSGSIKQGEPAAMIAVPGDPLNFPGSLNTIERLFFKGRAYRMISQS